LEENRKNALVDRLTDISMSHESGLLRMLTLGNAGGVIATLSFIGATLGGDKIPAYDRAAFWVLVFFIIGTSFSAAARYCEWKGVRAARKSITDKDSDPQIDHKSRMEMFHILGGLAVLFGLAALLIGIGSGLRFLWKMSS